MMTSIDDLINIPVYWRGSVLSVTPQAKGFSFVVRSDNGFGGYKRFASDNRELTGGLIHVGDTVEFLPGAATKRRGLPQAREVSIIRKKHNPIGFVEKGPNAS
jgi:hypothetical protein